MGAQVYADDQALRDGKGDSPPRGVATFDIMADAQADLLLRVSSVLNMLNVTPRTFNLQSHAGLVTVRTIVECGEHQAELIARKLRQLTAVREVGLTYGS